MKVAALVLGLVALALAIGLVLLIVDLKRISDDLDFINHADTNALVTTGSNIGLIRTLAARINAVLNKTRRLQITQAEQNKQVRQMLTNLTHDIKTPLTVARGYAQLLKEGSADQEQLSKILNNLQSVDRYLHYLMDFNLIQEKSVNLDLAKVNLSALVQQELFNAFDSLTARFQTDDQSRTKIRSTGLGLSIVDSLVDSLGGSMRLESANGIFLAHLLLSDAPQSSQS